MKQMLLIVFIAQFTACGIYTFTGADTSGAENFSVAYFKPQAPLATPLLAQNFSEALKDLVLQQSSLNLTDDDGDLKFEGFITGYSVNPVSVQSDETASLNRLQISVKVKYTNTLEKEKSFERSFTKYTDYDSSLDLISVEDELARLVIDQLTQEIFNASLGNW